MNSLLDCYGAAFSPCRRWRYRLWREFRPGPRALFCMMNPSTADEVQNDPTIERCVRRAQHWRLDGEPYGSVEVVNVFAWRETDSRKLRELIYDGIDIVGPENDRHIAAAAKAADIVVCGWGLPGNLLGRGGKVLELLRASGVPLAALEFTRNGTPQHPLYIGYDVPLKPIL